MPIGKVLARGQIMLPQEIRREASIRPGDTVMFRVIGPGTVELKVLPRLGLTEALERYQIEGPVNPETDPARWQGRATQDVLES